MSLNFKEKRALQKTVTEQQAALRGGSLGFKEKREAQKLLRDALAKLGAATKPEQSQRPRYVVYPADPRRGIFGANGYVVIAARPGVNPGSRVEKITEERFVVFTGDGETGGSGGPIGQVLRSRGKFKGKYGSVSAEYYGLVDEAVSVLTEIHANGGDPFATEAEPANESPFAPLLAGDFNRLPVPEFVTRLEGAYSEEEDLEKAKQAAIQYLEANRETLEAA